MSSLFSWIGNGLLGLASLGGLFLAAHGGTEESYYFGLTFSLIVFAIMASNIHRAIHNGIKE